MEPISRRQFLETSGRAALLAGLASQVGWLAACTKDAPPAESVAAADWETLAARLSGELVRPGDPGYATLRLPFNRRYANVHPAGIAYVRDPEDVRECVLWSRDAQVPIVARSGGHSYGGYSNSPGLIVDVSTLKSVEPDGGSGLVRVGAGARNTDVYNGLQPLGVAFSAGRCPTVGISGLTLGGGFGFSSRVLGLTADALTETEIVMADGTIRTCSPTEEPDLFWALRGGGGGNFGINTSFTFQAHPVDRVSIYSIDWPLGQVATALAAMQDLILTGPTELSCRMGAGGSGEDGPTSGGANSLGQFFGSKRDLRELLDPVLSATTPSKVEINETTFWQAKEYFFHTTPIDEFQEKSSFIDTAMPEEAFDTIAEWVVKWPGSSNDDGGGTAIFGWGGKMGALAPEETAFVHREAKLLMAFSTSWTQADPESVWKSGLNWIEGFHAAMQPYVSQNAYQNFIDPSLPDWESAYYGNNFKRLTEVKAKVDPDDVFTFAQAIPLASV